MSYFPTRKLTLVRLPDSGKSGNLYVPKLLVESVPSSAEILIDSVSTGFLTPHVFLHWMAGTYSLSRYGYVYEESIEDTLPIQDRNILLTGVYVIPPEPTLENFVIGFDNISFDIEFDGDYVSYFEIDVATDSEFTEFVEGYEGYQTEETSIVIDGLDPDTDYYIRVRAVYVV